MLIGGMSQGCVTAMEAGLSYPGALAGVAGFSGFLAPHWQKEMLFQEANSQRNVLIVHGDNDETVPLRLAERSYFSRGVLRNAGRVEYRVIKGLGHDICDQGC